jgi:hypothetical protein
MTDLSDMKDVFMGQKYAGKERNGTGRDEHSGGFLAFS